MHTNTHGALHLFLPARHSPACAPPLSSPQLPLRSSSSPKYRLSLGRWGIRKIPFPPLSPCTPRCLLWGLSWAAQKEIFRPLPLGLSQKGRPAFATDDSPSGKPLPFFTGLPPPHKSPAALPKELVARPVLGCQDFFPSFPKRNCKL